MRLLITALLSVYALTAMAGVTQRLDSLFEARYADAANAPGAAIIIADGDSVIYERYFGIADMGTGERISKDTRFNIASVSKQFTVVGLMQLPVDLNTPSSEYFDYPQPFWHDVTLAHLASHTSGIPDTRDRSDRQKCVLATDSTSALYFPTVKELKFTPGSDYDYLNPSFILLARVIEQTTGEEFTQYQQHNIFDAANMPNTYYFDPTKHPEHTAHGYEKKAKGKWAEYDYGEETFFATRPDGGIYSTARDMLNWEIALANGKVLDPGKLAKAYSPAVKVAGSKWCDYQNRPNTYYGLGWFIDKTPGRPLKVYHTGDNGGFQAYVAKYPETGLKIIVLENRHDCDRWAMAEAIDEIIFSEKKKSLPVKPAFKEYFLVE